MRKLALTLLLFLSFSTLRSQIIFSEDFDGIPGPTAGGAGTYSFPSGWFLRNVDNRTPDAQVSYVNDAWERREDFKFNVSDSAAFSTSFYNPAGAADDWMWTPLIGPLPANSVLKWNAVTYDALFPDGYEVRIMTAAGGPPTGGTGSMGNQLTNSKRIFFTAAESTAWIAHAVSLADYTGQSVYIGFRNNTTDKFLLLIDDVIVEGNAPCANISFTATPDSTICVPGNVTLTASGATTYLWDNGTTANPRIVNVSSDSAFAVTGTLSGCQDTDSIHVRINTVKPGTTGLTQVICSGGDPAVLIQTAVDTVRGTLTYRWEKNTTGCTSTFTTIPSATSATYDPPAGLTQTTYYRRVTISTFLGVTCEKAGNCTVVFVNDITAGSITGDQTTCSGGDPGIFSEATAATGSGVITYRWEQSTTNCSTGFTPSPGIGTQQTYDIPPGITQVTYFRRVAISTFNGASCEAISNCITVLINNVTAGAVAGDQTICSGGDPVAFTQTTSPTGTGTLSYRWEKSTNNCASGFTAIASSNVAAYDPPTGLTQTTYYRRVTISNYNAVDCEAISNCITVTVNTFTAGNIGADQVVCSGGDPTAINPTTIPSGAGTFTYRWESSTTNCSAGFTVIGGATNASYDPPAGATQTIYYRRVTISTLNSIACEANSNCVTITVNIITAGTVGSDQTICSGGDPAPFTQTVAGTGNGTLTYRWEKSTTNCSAGFSTIGGATGTTYDPPAGLTQTTYYRRITISVFPANTCEIAGNCITVTVNNVTAGSIGTDHTVCSTGDPAAFTQITAATGTGTLTYRWESSISNCSGGFSTIAGAGAATYDAPAGLTQTTYYRRITISTINSVSCEATSNCVTVTVNVITGGTIAGDQTICSGGDPVAFTQTIPATGNGTLTYRWESSTIGCSGPWTPIAAASGTTYDPPAGVIQTTYYRRITISTFPTSTCEIASNCITVTINSVTAGITGPDQTVCSGGDPAAFTVITAATGAGTLTYRWESSTTDCTAGFAIIPGAISATYDIPTGFIQRTYFRRIAISTLNSVSCEATGNCITVSPNSVTAGVTNSNQTICTVGDPLPFTEGTAPTATGTLSYRWEMSTVGCSGPWTIITNANAAVYDPPAGLTQTTYYRRITISTLNSIACEVAGNCVTVNINNLNPGVIGSSQIICANGNPIMFGDVTAASGNGTITFRWESSTTNCTTGFTPIAAAFNNTYDAPTGLMQTTYYRRVTISNYNGNTCEAISNCITVTVNPLPVILMSPVPTKVCLTDTLVTLNATPPGGTWSGPGVTGNKFSAAMAGTGGHTIIYTYTNANGCSNFVFTDIVAIDCTERHLLLSSAIHIYPNPSNGRFTVKFVTDKYNDVNIRVMDASGKTMKEYKYTGLIYENKIPIDLRNLGNGTYFVQLYNAFDKATFRAVIMH